MECEKGSDAVCIRLSTTDLLHSKNFNKRSYLFLYEHGFEKIGGVAHTYQFDVLV